MSMRNIKAGFKKCGVALYDPNAIDKERMLRNQLIPNLEVDLSVPPSTNEETPPRQTPVTLHNVEALDEESGAIGFINIFDESAVIESEIMAVNLPDAEIDSAIHPSSSSGKNENGLCDPKPHTSASECEPAPFSSSSTCTTKTVPIKIYVKTGVQERIASNTLPSENKVIHDRIEISFDADGSPLIKQGSKYKDNPLVKAGIITEDVADIFMPPDEEIPTGRKRPLRIRSKARLMTDEDVIADLQKQRDELKEKEERLRQRREKMDTGRKKKPVKKTAATSPVAKTSTSSGNSSREKTGLGR